MSTDFLREHSKTLRAFATQTAEAAKASPDDFWLNTAASVQADAAADAEQEYALALAMEAGELVDFRFIGPTANGSISLDAFLKIFEPLSRAIKLAAQRLRFGSEQGRIQSEISDILNLRLAGLAPGSTRVFVTANARPDLAGENLFDNTLAQVFRVLRASDDDFYDAIDAIGGRSAAQLKDALEAISAAGLAAEFSWHALRHSERWEGRPAEITRVQTLLSGLSEPESYEEIIRGTVSGLADTGRVVMRTTEGKAVIRFPLVKTEEVQQLRIADSAALRVSTTRYHDEIKNIDIYKRTLLQVL